MEDTTGKVKMLFKMARGDARYAAMSRKYQQLEEKAGQVLQKLGREDKDIVWDFICTSDAMNWRMLEILCERFGIDPEGEK